MMKQTLIGFMATVALLSSTPAFAMDEETKLPKNPITVKLKAFNKEFDKPFKDPQNKNFDKEGNRLIQTYYELDQRRDECVYRVIEARTGRDNMMSCSYNEIEANPQKHIHKEFIEKNPRDSHISPDMLEAYHKLLNEQLEAGEKAMEHKKVQ